MYLCSELGGQKWERETSPPHIYLEMWVRGGAQIPTSAPGNQVWDKHLASGVEKGHCGGLNKWAVEGCRGTEGGGCPASGVPKGASAEPPGVGQKGGPLPGLVRVDPMVPAGWVALAQVLLITLDGLLDAQQHGGEPLVQPGNGVILLHRLCVAVHVLLLMGF